MLFFVQFDKMDSQKVLRIWNKVENCLARGGGFATNFFKYRVCIAHE